MEYFLFFYYEIFQAYEKLFSSSLWITFWQCRSPGFHLQNAEKSHKSEFRGNSSTLSYYIVNFVIFDAHTISDAIRVIHFYVYCQDYIFQLFCLIVKLTSGIEYVWYGILLSEPQCKLNISALNRNQNYLISANTTETWTSQKGDNYLSFFPSKFRGKWRLGEEGRTSSEFPSYNNHSISLGTEL